MEKSGGSRLLQMKARFQQKQMQERELKIASLYEAQQARALDRVRHSPSNGVATSHGTAPSPPAQQPSVPIHPGKVRQMFEERRTKAGIDKSYPLQPIHNTDRPAPRKALPNGYTKVSTSTTSRASVERKAMKTSTVSHSVRKQQHKIENIVNGSGDLNHNHEPDLNPVKHMPKSNGELISSIDELDRADNNYLIEDETFPEALAGTPTPRSPEHQVEPKRPPRRSPPTRKSPTTANAKSQPVAPPRRVTSENAVSESSKARGAMQRTSNPVIRKQPVSGTEAEPFINKLRKQVNPTANTSSTKVNKPLNNNWRQKHEEFIQAIRAAKQVQAHLNAGGKLSDLPPPPPSENPDYVQCPHCNRRFNQGAAERHIPKCANYQFNKPKPGAAKKR